MKPETVTSIYSVSISHNLQQTTAFLGMSVKPCSDVTGFCFYLFISVSFHSAQPDTHPGWVLEQRIQDKQLGIPDPSGTCCVCRKSSPVHQSRTGEDSMMQSVGLKDRWKRTEAVPPFLLLFQRQRWVSWAQSWRKAVIVSAKRGSQPRFLTVHLWVRTESMGSKLQESSGSEEAKKASRKDVFPSQTSWPNNWFIYIKCINAGKYGPRDMAQWRQNMIEPGPGLRKHIHACTYS